MITKTETVVVILYNENLTGNSSVEEKERNSLIIIYPLGNKNKSKLIETANIVQKLFVFFSGFAYENVAHPTSTTYFIGMCLYIKPQTNSFLFLLVFFFIFFFFFNIIFIFIYLFVCLILFVFRKLTIFFFTILSSTL